MRRDEFPIIDSFVKKEINAVLDKIRNEIFNEIKRYKDVRDEPMTQWCYGKTSGLKRALEIVDKYK